MPEVQELENLPKNEKEEEQEFLFDAFISYRHAELDSAAAGYLQKALEHYRVPREIQKKCGKKGLKRIFRDEEELGAASDLFGEIEQNLKRSEFLLVICTPRLLESKWCMREIETFIQYRGRDNILAVLAEGEPETAFPPILLEEGEPLAVDIRGKNKREVLRRARQRMPRLAAPLLHCTYDELYQRHRVYRMHRMLAAAGVVAAASLGFGAVTVGQNMKITENYQGKLENQSKYLAKLSGELLAGGDREAALLVAMEALPQSAEDPRPYVAEARIALEKALYVYAADYKYYLRPQQILDYKGLAVDCFDVDDEENVILTFDGQAYIWDADTGEQLFCWGEDEREYIDAKLAEGHRLLMETSTGVLCVDYRSGKLLWEWELPECVENCRSTAEDASWAYCRETGTIFFTTRLGFHAVSVGEWELTDRHGMHLIDLATGESRVWMPEVLYEEFWAEDKYTTVAPSKVSFSPDGQSVAFVWGKWVDTTLTGCFRVVSLKTDQITFSLDFTEFNNLHHVSWLPEGDLVVVEKVAGEKGMVGYQGFPLTWRLTCWNMETKEPRFRYEDTSLALMQRIIIESVPAAEGKEDAHDLLTVIYDNVAVNLDRYTGEVYNRMEDRSGFILSHIWNSTLQVLITTDGYVFCTVVGNDRVWNPQLDAYHYFLDLGYIPKGVWHGEYAYLFTDNAVYRYSCAVDRNCTPLEKAPNKSWYNGNHTRLLIQDYDNCLRLYDTADFSLLWEKSVMNEGFGNAADILGDKWAVYLPPENGGIVFQSTADENEVRIPLPEISENTDAEWMLYGAGLSRAVLWNNNTPVFHKDTVMMELGEEKQNAAFFWLADADEGRIIEQWTGQEVADALPISEEELPEEWSFQIEGVRSTASGQYLVIGIEVSNAAFEGNFEETVLLVWDIARKEWVTLPQEACRGLLGTVSYQSIFKGSEWTAPQGDIVVLGGVSEGSQRLMVVDVAAGEILHQWTVEGIGSQELAFLPDGEHIIFQDASLCIQIYNWREGRYTSSSILPEKDAMRFEFCKEGEIFSAYIKPMSFSSEFCSLYRRTGEGEYRKETEISQCKSCDGSTVVIADGEQSRLYRYYQLDDLLAQAREVLGGRELTEVERKNYLID